VKPVRKILALVLLAFWPVMTSHALLEEWEFIHHVHEDHDGGDGSHEHNSEHHEFADGGYLRGLNDNSIWKPNTEPAFFLFILPSLCSIAERGLFGSGPSPPGTAPPEFSTRWHFSHRTALLARAPSLVS